MEYHVSAIETSTLIFLSKIVELLILDGFVVFPSQEDYAVLDGRAYGVYGEPKIKEHPVSLDLINKYIEKGLSESEFINFELNLKLWKEG